MDIKQLRQLSRKLMKANKSLLILNEKLHANKKQVEQENEKLRNEFGTKLEALEKENATFKRLLKAEESLNNVDEILSKTTIEALKTEIANQEGRIMDPKTVASHEMKSSIVSEAANWNPQSDVLHQLEMKIQTMKNDKSLMIFKYEKELEESQNFYIEEQRKMKSHYENRIASVEKQNQNLKSQINVLASVSDKKKKNCDVHTKALADLKLLHKEELEEVERNLAFTLSQQMHTLTNVCEQEKSNITKEKDAEITELTENCRELSEVIGSLQEQASDYPELLEKHENLERQFSKTKERCDVLEREIEKLQGKNDCKDCEVLKSRVKELQNELAALRKLEEDNILLTGENKKLIEQLKVEKQKLDLIVNRQDMPDSDSSMKLEELHNEKRSSKMKENSKKYLKKRISQLENDCKDLWRKLQSEILKSKQQELVIKRERIEKERVHALHGAQVSNSFESGEAFRNNAASSSSNNKNEDGSISEEKDNDLSLVKEQLQKSQSRTHLLQTEIDRLRESYSNNLSKELEEMENKWTQRLRRECGAVHSEMAEELRKQKDAWRKKESEMHSAIKELQIQTEEIERERKSLEKELNALRTREKNVQKQLLEAKTEQNSVNDNNATSTGTEENQMQDYISDRDLRRLASKLKKDQWLSLAKLLSLSETDIREIDQLNVGKEEKAFRILSEWRTCAEEAASNQVSQLVLALEGLRRKDLAQFVMEHCTTGKVSGQLIGA